MDKKWADKNVRKWSCYTHASKVEDLSSGIFWGKVCTQQTMAAVIILIGIMRMKK